MVILNKYKDSFDDLMDSLDIESLKVTKSKSAPISTKLDLEEDHLDKDRKSQRGEKNR